MYRLHLSSAYGYYHHLMFKCQSEFAAVLKLNGFLDFSHINYDSTSSEPNNRLPLHVWSKFWCFGILAKNPKKDQNTIQKLCFLLWRLVSRPHKINVGHIHFLKMHIFCVKKMLFFLVFFWDFLRFFTKIPISQNLLHIGLAFRIRKQFLFSSTNCVIFPWFIFSRFIFGATHRFVCTRH